MAHKTQKTQRASASRLTEKSIKRVRALTFHFLKGHGIDPEDIVGEVLLDCVRRDILPTRIHVQRRVWDALRKKHKEKKLEKSMLERQDLRDWRRLSSKDELDVERLTRNLSSVETRIVVMKFWHACTLDEIAHSTGLSREGVRYKLFQVLEVMKDTLIGESFGE